MAKSRARKMRDKLVREGFRDPGNGRGTYALQNLTTRKTKTKQETLQKTYKKQRHSHEIYNENDRCFYLSS
ncbi:MULTISPECIES: hypothetical protein [Bacillus]|uniref:hypothetical protein n=1 Tax=Bacillus TaxID=1386 RepID=UPI000BB76177|nr:MULTISPECIES: hypothetical protein [Bacillus]